MAPNDKPHRFDFQAWAGVQYVIDPNIPPDHFFADPYGVFHIGEGTDVQTRLFWLSLTLADRKWLKKMFIGWE